MPERLSDARSRAHPYRIGDEPVPIDVPSDMDIQFAGPRAAGLSTDSIPRGDAGRIMNRGMTMTRMKWVAIAAALLLLSGCVSDYAYRGGSGDYYYSRPSTQYVYGAPYGSLGYGYPGGWYGSIGYGYGYGGYGYPYRYSPRYGYGYWPYYYHPHHYRPRRPPHQPDRPGTRPETPGVAGPVMGGQRPPIRRPSPNAEPGYARPLPDGVGVGGPGYRQRQQFGGQPVMRPQPSSDQPRRTMGGQPMTRPPQSAPNPAPARSSPPAPRPAPMPRPASVPRGDSQQEL